MDHSNTVSAGLLHEPILAAPQGNAVTDFSVTLNNCVNAWLCGYDTVLINDDIQELFGDVLMHYFQVNLAQEVGGPVAFALIHHADGPRTQVQMPNNGFSLGVLHLGRDHQSGDAVEPEKVMADSESSIAGAKKAPRPMNCWIIFRDAMHKKLKSEHPELTVQQICK